MFVRLKVVLAGLAVVWLGGTHIRAITLTEDFSSDPFAVWSFGIGDNSNAQFAWNSSAPAAYTGDAVITQMSHRLSGGRRCRLPFSGRKREEAMRSATLRRSSVRTPIWATTPSASQNCRKP